jgi:outer membrane lipoprotein SlyB
MKYFPAFSIAFILCSCTSNAITGAIAGGLVGAGGGAIANGAKGSWIGGAIGVVTGAIIGAVLDAQDRKVMEKSSPRTVDRMDRGEALTINDVIKLSQTGVSDDTIMRYMKETTSSYNLSQAQVRRLQDAGVSQRVINDMVASGK